MSINISRALQKAANAVQQAQKQNLSLGANYQRNSLPLAAPPGQDDHLIGLQEYKFNSYSGSDTQIFLVVDTDDTNHNVDNFRQLIEIQTLSVSSARSVSPVRRIGESHASEYTRGARTIAGSMVFAVGVDDIFSEIASVSNRDKKSLEPFFTDEMSNFSILITCVNEYGQASSAALTDVTLTNFGATWSVDDMYHENTYSYVARHYSPLSKDPSMLNNLRVGNNPGPLSKLFKNLSNNEDFGLKDHKKNIEDAVAQELSGILNPRELKGYTEWVKENKTP